ncbi:MAG: Panacea domain-containing protein [bacterium]|nr:Panacea domain-containing protein [bacterium]
MYNQAFAQKVKTLREDMLKLTQLQLATLLGMGVATINRIENAGTTTEAHRQLIESLEDQSTLIRLLEGKEDDLGKTTYLRLVELAKSSLARHSLLKIKYLQEQIADPQLTGKRKFDLDRLIQMILFFTRYGEWKTKLNKLLFYADFLSYHNLSNSISGTRYVRGSYGPIPDHYQQLFAALLESGQLQAREEFSQDDKPIEKLIAKENFDRFIFSKKEIQILEYVYQYFKDKTAREVVDISHEEPAFRDTEDGDPISYLAATTLKLKFSPPAKPQRTLAQLAKDAIAQTPISELKKLPKDGATNHDLYLYGDGKKSK